MLVATRPDRGIAQMRTSLGSLLLLAALTLQTACSGTTSSSAADVTGSWSGTYADTKTGVTGPLAASFSEQNGSLGGTLTISSGWCARPRRWGT